MAVSGLASHALGSWKERDGYNVWLRDFLPKDIPGGVRILIYGYNTELRNSKDRSSIRELAKTFLQRLKSAREKVRVETSEYTFVDAEEF